MIDPLLDLGTELFEDLYRPIDSGRWSLGAPAMVRRAMKAWQSPKPAPSTTKASAVSTRFPRGTAQALSAAPKAMTPAPRRTKRPSL